MKQEDSPWFAEEVLAGRTVAVSSLEEMPAKAAHDREVCRQIGVKSNLSIPLSLANGPKGTFSRTGDPTRKSFRTTRGTPARRSGSPHRTQELRQARRSDRPPADQIRDNLQQRYDNLFTPKWWRDHPEIAKKYYQEMGRYPRHYWWRRATWAAAAGWFAGAWSQPMDYDYGESVDYEGEQVYVEGAPVATAEE